MKGLVIHKNWLDLILEGDKTWELRSTATRIRGRVALIEKGSGQVKGIAEIRGVEGPLDQQDLLDSIDKHCVPESYWSPFSEFKWRFAWKLEGIKKFKSPVPYHHRPGAVIWVQLGTECLSKIEEQIGEPDIDPRSEVKTVPRTSNPGNPKSETWIKANNDQPVEIKPGLYVSGSAPDSYISGEKKTNRKKILLTQGNINNGHFYLTRVADWFPEDVFGGANKESPAPREVSISWGNGAPVHTDIAKNKMIFRSRSWVKEFFESHAMKAGDALYLEKVSDYEYLVYPA